jgi:hypothetical protein
MRKQEAAEKVAKLMKLARDNPNPHEQDSARSRARKIVEDNHLSVEDLSAGKKAAAFDDLVAAIRRKISTGPAVPAGLFGTSDIVSGILSKLESMSRESKSRRLDEAYKLVEAASLFNGALTAVGLGTSVVGDVKKIFEETLAAHDLTPPH